MLHTLEITRMIHIESPSENEQKLHEHSVSATLNHENYDCDENWRKLLLFSFDELRLRNK